MSTARALARRGVQVALVSRSMEKLAKLIEESGDCKDHLKPISCDVSDPSAVNKVFDEFLSNKEAKLDFVLYNAG